MDKGLGVVLLVGVVLLLWARRAEAAPPEEPEPTPPEEGAGIQIQVFDAAGNPVPSQSPVGLDEGADYTIQVSVTNLSTRAGQPWEATFTISTSVQVGVTYLLVEPGFAAIFAPGETKAFSFPIHIPDGTGGQSGDIYFSVVDPSGQILVAEASEPVAVLVVEIVYGASAVIGVA